MFLLAASKSNPFTHPRVQGDQDFRQLIESIVSIWSAYAICFAIGYMLLIRPMMKYSKKGDVAFYLLVVILSTMKYFS